MTTVYHPHGRTVCPELGLLCGWRWRTDHTHGLTFKALTPHLGEPSLTSLTQFPHLGREDSIHLCLMGLLQQSNGLRCVKFKVCRYIVNALRTSVKCLRVSPPAPALFSTAIPNPPTYSPDTSRVSLAGALQISLSKAAPGAQ